MTSGEKFKSISTRRETKKAVVTSLEVGEGQDSQGSISVPEIMKGEFTKV